MFDTVNRAALRFNDKKFDDYSKILFIITDGEYERELQVKKTITLLKQSKVVVVCGCISDSISKIDFRREAHKKAKQGVQNLIDVASTFDECPELVKLIDNGEITVKKENKLCIHVNQPSTINAIMNTIIK